METQGSNPTESGGGFKGVERHKQIRDLVNVETDEWEKHRVLSIAWYDWEEHVLKQNAVAANAQVAFTYEVTKLSLIAKTWFDDWRDTKSLSLIYKCKIKLN